MDVRDTIKKHLTTNMAKVNHVERSKDHSELSGMISEKKVKINKETIYEILDEVTKVEGDLEEIRLAKNKLNTDKADVVEMVKKDIEEITGAASAGGFLGPLFSAPIKRGGPIKKSKNKKEYEVSEEKGQSPFLVSDENPTGETDGLTPDILTKILTKIAKTHEEDEGEVKKVEATEATLASSSGSYETPFFLAKNKKNWRGMAKTLYKGGKFVKVKEKCRTFPYCNQGDINALELFEGYNELAEKVANKMGEDSLKVKSIVLNDLEESLFQERMKELNKDRIEKSEKKNRLVKK
jgi:predicted transcriptional regulator